MTLKKELSASPYLRGERSQHAARCWDESAASEEVGEELREEARGGRSVRQERAPSVR